MRKSADFLEFAAAAGGFGVFDLDLVTGDIGGAPLFFDLIGLRRRETLTREEWLATIHPEDLEAVAMELSAAIDSGTKYQAEYRALMANGEIRWLTGRGEIVNDAEDRPARVVRTISDITPRTHLEEKLRHAPEPLTTAQRPARTPP